MKYFRFSLRTLALLMLTGGAGAALWHNFQPWRIDRTYQGHGKNYRSVYFSKDQEWILGYDSKSFMDGAEEKWRFQCNLWNVRSSTHFTVVDAVMSATKRRETVRHIAASTSPNSHWLCAYALYGDSRHFTLWNIQSQTEVRIPDIDNKGFVRASFTNDNRMLLLHLNDDSLHWFDLAARKVVHTIPGVRYPFHHLDSDRIALVGFDDSIRICEATTGAELYTIPRQEGWEVGWIAYKLQNRVYVTMLRTETDWEHDDAYCWMAFDFGNPEPVFTRPGQIITISPSERLASIRKGETVEILDLQNNTVLFSAEDRRYQSWVLWSPDEALILFPYRPMYCDLTAGNKIYFLEKTDVAFPSSDWTLLLSEGSLSKDISIRRTSDGKVLQTIKGHTLSNEAFSKDDRHFLSADEKLGKVFLWTRYRPEEWWGVAYLVEFWLTLLLGGATVWSVVKDRRGLARGL